MKKKALIILVFLLTITSVFTATGIAGKKKKWKVYYNSDYDFSIRYPKGYKLQSQPMAPNSIHVSSFNIGSSIGSPVQFVSGQPELSDTGSVSVEIYSNPSELPVENWMARTFPSVNDYAEVKPLNIVGVEGLQLLGGENALFIDTFLPKGDKVFQIRLRLPNQERNQEIEKDYQTMLESFVTGQQ